MSAMRSRKQGSVRNIVFVSVYVHFKRQFWDINAVFSLSSTGIAVATMIG